jgi:hypothetical protein
MDEDWGDDATLADRESFERPASPLLNITPPGRAPQAMLAAVSTRSSTSTAWSRPTGHHHYIIGSVGWRSGHQDVAVRTLAELDSTHSIHRRLIPMLPLRRRAMGVVVFDSRTMGVGTPGTPEPWFARRVGRFHVQYRSRVPGLERTINRVRTEHFAAEAERHFGRTNVVWYIIQWDVEDYGTDGLGLI